jgi:hypothetical protein
VKWYEHVRSLGFELHGLSAVPPNPVASRQTYRDKTLGLFGLPGGERVFINDRKPSGLPTAFAVSVVRDSGLEGVEIHVDESL